jgi:hypothetical protein
MSAARKPTTHIVAKVAALDLAVAAAGFSARRQFAEWLEDAYEGAPSRATTMNLWLGNGISTRFAEVILEALKAKPSELFELANGWQIQ